MKSWGTFHKRNRIEFNKDEEFRTFYPYRDRTGKRLFVLTTKRIYKIKKTGKGRIVWQRKD